MGQAMARNLLKAGHRVFIYNRTRTRVKARSAVDPDAVASGVLDRAEGALGEGDLQSAFGRPWTRLFIDSHKDKEVADRDVVGHRGTFIGRIEAVHRDRKGRRIRFRSWAPMVTCAR